MNLSNQNSLSSDGPGSEDTSHRAGGLYSECSEEEGPKAASTLHSAADSTYHVAAYWFGLKGKSLGRHVKPPLVLVILQTTDMSHLCENLLQE